MADSTRSTSALTMPELTAIEATISKLREERDQYGGSLLLIIEALGFEGGAVGGDELEAAAEWGEYRARDLVAGRNDAQIAARRAGFSMGENTLAEVISTLHATSLELAKAPTQTRPVGETIRPTEPGRYEIERFRSRMERDDTALPLWQSAKRLQSILDDWGADEPVPLRPVTDEEMSEGERLEVRTMRLEAIAERLCAVEEAIAALSRNMPGRGAGE